MITLRLATYLTGITAVAGLVFGWATPMFAVGMIAIAVWLILYGLLVYLEDNHLDDVMRNYQPPITTDELFRMREQDWTRRHRESLQTKLTRPDGSVTTYRGLGPIWDGVETELPYRPAEPRPTWDANLGSIE
jgi:hypothetical protein